MSSLLRVTMSHSWPSGPKQWSFVTRTFRRLKFPNLMELYGTGTILDDTLVDENPKQADVRVARCKEHALSLGFKLQDTTVAYHAPGKPFTLDLAACALGDLYGHSFGMVIDGPLTVPDPVVANILAILGMRASDGHWFVFMRREGTKLYLFLIYSSLHSIIFAPKRTLSRLTRLLFLLLGETFSLPHEAINAYIFMNRLTKIKDVGFTGAVVRMIHGGNESFLRDAVLSLRAKVGNSYPLVNIVAPPKKETDNETA